MAVVLALMIAAASDVTVVHTGEDGAYEAAQVVARRLAGDLVYPAMTNACMHDPACALRPTTEAIVVVTVYTADAGWVVHLELVAKDGSTSRVEDVRTTSWDVMPALVAPAAERLLGLTPPPPPPSTSMVIAPIVVPAETSIGDLWEIGTAVIGVGCCALGGLGLVGLMLASGASVVEIGGNASEACNNIGQLPACLCALPVLAVEGCVAAIELLGTFIQCLETANACLSCQVPQAALVSSSFVIEPTEGGPPAPRSDAMRF